MIALISRWKLKNGCPPELATALQAVAGQVKAAEPDTLIYTVHLQARVPLDQHNEPVVPPVRPILPDEQTEVVFFEAYKDAAAFSHHVNGLTFTKFRTENMKYFYEDPDNPGWPNTENEFLDRQSAFFRSEAE